MAFFSHTLQSSDSVISSGDVIGMLSYAASNEVSGSDAILIAGQLASIAEGDFTAIANPASLVFSTSTSADAVEQMRLTSEGYLGINTQYPASELHVGGNTTIDGSATISAAPTGRNLTIGGDADFTAAIQILGSGMSGGGEGLLIAESNAGAAYIYQYENAPIYFGTGGTYRAGLSAAGTLMVGGSSSTLGQGGVELYAAALPELKLTNATTGTGALDGSSIRLESDDLHVINREAASIILETSNTERVVVDLDGNVGVGTSTPSYRFHSKDGSGEFFHSGLGSYTKATGGNNVFSAVTNASGLWAMGTDENHELKFWKDNVGVANNDIVTITDTGLIKQLNTYYAGVPTTFDDIFNKFQFYNDGNTAAGFGMSNGAINLGSKGANIKTNVFSASGIAFVADIHSNTYFLNPSDLAYAGFKREDELLSFMTHTGTAGTANKIKLYDAPTVDCGFGVSTSQMDIVANGGITQNYYVDGVKAMQINSGGVVVNPDSGEESLRVAGNTNYNLFFVDASTDRIGIGTSTPTNFLNVNAVGEGAGTHTLLTGDDNSYMSVQNNGTGDYLKLGNVYTAQAYMGLSHSDMSNSQYMVMCNGVHTFVSSNSGGSTYIRGGGNNSASQMRVSSNVEFTGPVVFNEAGSNYDFRVEGDTDQYLIFADASKDSVLIGTSTDGGVGSKLNVFQDYVANTTIVRTQNLYGRCLSTVNGTYYQTGINARAEKHLASGVTDGGYCIGGNFAPIVFGEHTTIAEVTALRCSPSFNVASTGCHITNMYALKVVPYNGGVGNTITNNYGVYIPALSTATNSYGVYQGGASETNRFAGATSFGSTSAPRGGYVATAYGFMSVEADEAKLLVIDGAVASKMQASTNNSAGVMGTESAHPLHLYAGNSAQVVVSTDGKFGIGNGTTAPVNVLDVHGNLTDAMSFYMEDGSPPASGQRQQFKIGTADKAVSLEHYQSHTNAGAVDFTNVIRMGNQYVSIESAWSCSLGCTYYPAVYIDTETKYTAFGGADDPTTYVDIDGDKMRIRDSLTPASGSAPGNQGDMCWDASYLYICTATDTWKRTTLSTF